MICAWRLSGSVTVAAKEFLESGESCAPLKFYRAERKVRFGKLAGLTAGRGAAQ